MKTVSVRPSDADGALLWAATHVGDDGDEGVGDGEGEALRRSRLEAFLHQGEAVLPAEQAHVAQQVQWHLHILRGATASLVSGSTDRNTGPSPAELAQLARLWQ